MSEYRGIDGVTREITKEYRGVDGVARRIIKAYRGVDGVARRYFGHSYNLYFDIGIADPSICTDLGSTAGIVNGNIELRAYAKFTENTGKRIYVSAYLFGSELSSKPISFSYSFTGRVSGWHESAFIVHLTGGIEYSRVLLNSGDNTYNTTLPKNVESIQFVNFPGAAGTIDSYLTIKKLKIGDDVII